jgi:hypothetical protein
VSKRNTRTAKASRRKERARSAELPYWDDSLADVHSMPELVGMAERGETLPCGCDAHQLLHSGGWHTFDD